MGDVATVEMTNPATGGVAFRREDGSYVLAEQLDAKTLRIGQRLVGRMDSMGTEQVTDSDTRESYGIFVQAYGLTLAAVQEEFA